ncbi:MAG: hypothetical protein M0Z25_02090 [Nitrospiraceae bacterium]|nr:hypothetical protein [Nitrospiraceae bacterium]
MEGQPVAPPRILRVRNRPSSASLSPQALVARLLWARRGTGHPVTWEDYRKARESREGGVDIDLPTFRSLLETTRPDPGFLWRDHPFRPGYRDADGREYEVLATSPDRIDLLREDGVTGYSSWEEFREFFIPIVQTEEP